MVRHDVARALAVVGHKWTLLIIEDLLSGPRRFTEIERALGDVNPKMVTTRLRELVAAGLVSRTYHAEMPPRVVYALTERGRHLRPVVEALGRWGARHQERTPQRRAAAGTTPTADRRSMGRNE